MAKDTIIRYVPAKTRGKKGVIEIFYDGKLIHKRAVDPSFDPNAMDLTRHCCDNDLVSNCTATPDGPCSGGKIVVWM
jgi:hypothetical protein